ncbi:MAG: Uncharacterized protein FD147_2131 [Chloroflexi bacterium]|nr:MAG: Uncharacterized protein FD147_2131 [Chloroflexota bacterium]MBA4375874.1 hypothetical protein [Anaerolinea sp.]
MGLTDFSFTPSEFILLHGDKFAPEAKNKESHQLLCSDGMVNGSYLASMIIAAAILANEEEGALSIEVKHQKKNVFSSKQTSHVYIRPVGQPPNWSGYTLESAILFTAGQFFAVQGEYNVYNVVFSLLMEDHKDPWQKIIEIVEWGLASSNWLMPVEGDAASAFLTPFICPERVRELAFAQPLEPVRQLITNCKRNTPEVWNTMLAEIDQAFKDRKI